MSENFTSELLVALDNVLSNGEGVAQLIFDVFGLLDSLADLVNAARLQCNTDCLVELVVLIAALEHLIDDILHLGVYLNALFLLINDSNPLFDVLVDALMYQGLNILAALVQVELVPCLQGKAERLFVLLKVVEDLRSQRSSQIFLGEGWVVYVGLSTIIWLTLIFRLNNLTSLRHGQRFRATSNARSGQAS